MRLKLSNGNIHVIRNHVINEWFELPNNEGLVFHRRVLGLPNTYPDYLLAKVGGGFIADAMNEMEHQLNKGEAHPDEVEIDIEEYPHDPYKLPY